MHNLYRNHWSQMLLYSDNFAMPSPPDAPMLEFRQSVEDVFTRNGGGRRLKAAVTRLMKHPLFREAHGTDDHFMAACFVAGLVGEEDDEKEKEARLGAEDWELVNMCNSQFTVGRWGRVAA